MTVSLLTPSRSGSARKLGASTMVKSGVNPGRSSGGGVRNRLLQKMLAQAVSVYARTERRQRGWAPT